MHKLLLEREKKALQLLVHLKKRLGESDGKPNKIWVYKNSEFFHKSMKTWLENNNIDFSQHTMKENLLFLKDLLLELWRTKYIYI